MYLVMGIHKIKFVDCVVSFATFSKILFQKLQLIVDNKQWTTSKNNTPPPLQPTVYQWILVIIVLTIETLTPPGPFLI